MFRGSVNLQRTIVRHDDDNTPSVAETPFGTVPVLQFEDGRMIGQGGTIARVVAHQCGLQGKDPTSMVIADMVFDALMDVRETILAPLFYAKDDEAKTVQPANMVLVVYNRHNDKFGSTKQNQPLARRYARPVSRFFS